MAKRFTDTGMYDQAWFRKLPPRLKCAWDWLCKRCDVIGALTIDMERLSFEVGESVTLTELESNFKVQVFDGDKIFIPAFVPFQYGDESGRLSPKNRFHLSIAEKLKARGFAVPEFKPLEGDPVSVPTPLPSGIDTVSDVGGAPQGRGRGQGRGNSLEGGVGETNILSGTPRATSLVEFWNSQSEKLPPCSEITYTRGSLISQRLREKPDIEYWRAVIERIAKSPHCTGKSKGGWRASFDWMLSADNAVRVMEGQYDADASTSELDTSRWT